MADTITNKLRKVLQAKLKTLCQDVSYRVARGAHAGEFVVFALSNSLDDELLWQTTLEVNVLGRGQNTTPVETLADDIWMALDHFYYLADGLGFTIYQTSRGSVDEETDSLNHLRLIFQLRLYK